MPPPEPLPHRTGARGPSRRRASALLALCLLAAATGAPAEEIALFRSEVVLGRGDRFAVVETVDYDFGATPRHGIDREIPLRRGKTGARMRVAVLGVEDGDGTPRPHRVSEDGDRLRIRIGDPARTVTGLHRYLIRYRAEGAILFHPDSEELYWNLTGNGWRVPIRRAEGRILLPEGTPAAAVRLRCFAGPRGSRADSCRVYRGHEIVEVESRGRLGPGEGLTVAVALPGGTLTPPGRIERTVRALSHAGVGWFLLPLGAGGLLLLLWRRNGRDPVGRGSIPVAYEPPEGLAPAEVGAILDERFDPRDLAATVLDLAVRGWLGIAEVRREDFLFLSRTDYRIERRPPPAGSLRPFEEALLAALLGGRQAVLVSSLRNRFHREVPAIERALWAALSGPGRCFPVSPARVRRLYAGAAIAVWVLGSAASVAWQKPPAGLSAAATALLVFAFGRVMPRRSRRGRAVLEQILGFREFLERVDRDRLERLGARTPEHFERILPHAVVLGVADAWADAFADLLVAPPRWFRGSASGPFEPRSFVSDLGRGLDTIGRSLTSSPRGSGSGFSGGSSGGGFGGGGGGSW